MAELPKDQFINKVGPEIRTARLILRPLRDTDAEAVFDLRSRSEVMVWSQTKLPDPDLPATLRRMCRWNEAGNLGMAMVELSNPSRLGGVLEYNTRDGRMEVGYLIHPDLWGRGYATEALKAAIQAWWEGYEADRPPEGMADELYAVTHTGNVPSYRVLTKCGFEKTEDFQDEHGPGEVWRLRRRVEQVDK